MASRFLACGQRPIELPGPRSAENAAAPTPRRADCQRVGAASPRRSSSGGISGERLPQPGRVRAS